MRNIILTIEYEGTRYSGITKAKNKNKFPAILSKLEAVLEKQLEETVQLIPAVKTEAGVHAKAQIVNFTTNSKMELAAIKSVLNQYLPKDIRVNAIQEGDGRFHADFNKEKAEFHYCINMAPYKDVFLEPYELYTDSTLDINQLKKAAKLLEGKRDYACFCANAKMKKSTIRTIDYIDVTAVGEKVKVAIQVDDIWPDFLLYATGTMLQAAKGELTLGQISEMLETAEKGSLCAYKAPAKGLILSAVFYPNKKGL